MTTDSAAAGACPSFQYNREYGAITNPQKLTPGLYDVVARVKIGTKTKQMKAKVSIGTCGFDQNVVVSFLPLDRVRPRVSARGRTHSNRCARAP